MGKAAAILLRRVWTRSTVNSLETAKSTGVRTADFDLREFTCSPTLSISSDLRPDRRCPHGLSVFRGRWNLFKQNQVAAVLSRTASFAAPSLSKEARTLQSRLSRWRGGCRCRDRSCSTGLRRRWSRHGFGAGAGPCGSAGHRASLWRVDTATGPRLALPRHANVR